MLGKTISMAIIISIIISSLFAGWGVATPTVNISGGNILKAGEIKYVNGTGFVNNTTVSVDLIIPSGVIVNGVANTMTDQNGDFSTTFTVPDYNGQGYVKVMCGADVISTLVDFRGTLSYDLQVDYPDKVYTNQSTRFKLLQPALNDKNWVVICKVTNPDMEITESYSVLHEGVSIVYLTFDMTGEHVVKFDIDGAKSNWTRTININQGGASQDGGNDSDVANITWTVTNIDNSYTVSVFAEGVGYIGSGVIRVIKPDSTIVDVPIVSSTASITADNKGTYQMQFTYNNNLFTKEFTYSPTITISSTSFSNAGITTITATINGEIPSDTLTVSVTSDAGQSSLTLLDGVGTYTANEVGTYTFTLTYRGATATTTSTYSETYSVRDFRVLQSDDMDYLSITGKVIGDNSNAGKSNARVIITIDEIGYSAEAKTTSSGSFSIYVPLSSSDKGGILGGATVTVGYEYGESQDSQSITLHNNWIKDLWLLWIVIVFLIALYAKEKGIIYKYLHVLPPRGSRGEDDGSLDDFDDQTF